MATTNSVSSLKAASASSSFNNVANNGFAVVTVYDAYVWDYDTVKELIVGTDGAYKKIDEILLGASTTKTENGTTTVTYNNNGLLSKLNSAIKIDSLTASTATSEAETASIKAGIRNTTLFKYLKDKTCTLEISDALGSLKSWTAFQGAIGEDFDSAAAAKEWSGSFTKDKNSGVIHLGANQPSYKTILGKSYFLDATTGNEVEVYILFYKFMGDGAMTLAMDPSSDASVFSVSGELAGQKILVGTAEAGDNNTETTVFYSICSTNFPA